VVDEQDAFEVVHLVLQAGGQQAVHLLFVDLAVKILPAGADAGRAFDIGVDFRDRKAAFGIDRMLFRRIEISGLMNTRGSRLVGW
jgi:hypothetical protein